MGYWKKGVFVGDADEDQQTIKQIDKVPLELVDAHGSWSRCAQDHSYWAVTVDELLHGDGSSPGHDKAVVQTARRHLNIATREGVDIGTVIYVVVHEEKILRRRAIASSAMAAVKERRDREHRREQAEAGRLDNLKRIGREYPHWPKRGERWRRVSDGQEVVVTDVHDKVTHWETATHYGRCSLGDFIAEYRWIEQVDDNDEKEKNDGAGQ